MKNPVYAQRVWNRLRLRRPLSGPTRAARVGPSDNTRQEAEKPKNELAEMFAGGARSAEADRASTNSIGEPIMIKLNAGVSRKVGEQNYGSRGASVNVELELESAVVHDVNLLHERIRKLFGLARDAVNEELGLPPAGSRRPSPPGDSSPPPANGNGNVRPATDAQLRVITAVSDNLGLDPGNEAQTRIGKPFDQLTRPEASRLIDGLKAVQNGR